MDQETIFTAIIPAILIFCLVFYNVRKMQKNVKEIKENAKCSSCSGCANSASCNKPEKNTK